MRCQGMNVNERQISSGEVEEAGVADVKAPMDHSGDASE